jgi:hypothetical protein
MHATLLPMAETVPLFYVIVAPRLRMRVSRRDGLIDEVCDKNAARPERSGRTNANRLNTQTSRQPAR